MISVIVPSLDKDYFSALAPKIMDTGVPDERVEIICVSPHAPQLDPMVIWVDDAHPVGCCSAFRRGLQASRGSVCVLLNDDLRLDPGWLAPSLAMLTKPNQIVAIPFGPDMACFGLRYANIPLFFRQTALDHWPSFYPYCTFFGDVSFSLSVWKSGGEVIQGPGQPIHFIKRSNEPDGINHPESPRKIPTLPHDTRRFLRDHHELAEGWLMKHWQLWNWDQTQGPWPKPEQIR